MNASIEKEDLVTVQLKRTFAASREIVYRAWFKKTRLV